MTKETNPKAPSVNDKYAGIKLRILRLKKDMTQRELANKVNVTFQQIQKYERGVNRISIGTLYDICTALEVQPAEFLQDFYQEQKVAEETEQGLSEKIIEQITVLPESMQKNVLQYIKKLAKNNKTNKEN